MTKGSMEPAIVPHITTPTRANITVNAMRNQCGPYVPNSRSQSETRTKPTEPRMPPSARPDSTSRRMISHQSCSVTSPTASARIISEAACEPLLPPEEITSGTNSASTTARAISFSK